MKKLIFQAVLSIFIPVLLGGLASGQGMHNDITRTGCLDCHRSLPLSNRADGFLKQSDQVCYGCHESGMSEFSHPVDVIPSMKIPLDMPLSESGTLLCITCHTFHTSPSYGDTKRNLYLRRQARGEQLCFICHRTSFPLSPR